MLAEVVLKRSARTHRDERSQSSQRLMTALDAINRRLGRDTAFYAGSGIRRDWKGVATKKTQHFTTDWRQLLPVTA